MSAKPWESGRNFASQVRNPGSAVIGKSAPARNQGRDRKSTRLNSSHSQISYAVFCLKKKNNSYNEFEIVAANLLDHDPRRVSSRIIAYALFIAPPLGRAGMTEAQDNASWRKAWFGTR